MSKMGRRLMTRALNFRPSSCSVVPRAGFEPATGPVSLGTVSPVSDVTIFSRVLSLASSSERIRLSYLGGPRQTRHFSRTELSFLDSNREIDDDVDKAGSWYRKVLTAVASSLPSHRNVSNR